MSREFRDRCPQKYQTTDEFDSCEFGKERVTWMQNNPRTSIEEENAAPGCPWAIDSLPQYGNCWWKFMELSGATGTGCSEDSISKSLHISVRQVREILNQCKKTMMMHKSFAEMKELCASGDLFTNSHEDDADLDFFTPTSFSFVEHNTRTVGSGEDDGSESVPSGDGQKRVIRRGPKATPLVPSPDL